MSTAIVTGAGGGLGRAIAVRLAEDGHAIAVVDINQTDAEETCNVIRATETIGDAVAKPYVVDLRDVSAIEAMVADAEETLGPVSVLVNNAAVFPAGSVAALLREADRPGAIVNVGSITQHGGWAEMVPYATTKGAAATMTRALATELGPFEIRVNCIAPGAFPTRAEEMHADPEAYSQRIIDSQALKRRGQLTDVAAAVSFLAGPEAGFVTGQTLNVDGGWIMA